MPDDLRTRIAKALYGQLFWITTPFEDQPDEVKDTWLFEADIVIRELGPLVRYWDKDFKELHYCRQCGGPMDD